MIERSENVTDKNVEQEKKPVAQTQWQLIWKQFKRHRLAMIGLAVLTMFYLVGVLCPAFFAPYGKFQEFEDTNIPPQQLRFFDEEGNFHFRPFVYNYQKEMIDWEITYTEDTSKRFPVYFLTRGEEYKFWGFHKTDLHFFGVEEGGKIFLTGTDELGRDVLSRIIYAMRISLTVGFLGVFLSLVLGLIFGGISGLMGGVVDDIIQRIIEMFLSIPKIPLWMALAAAVPQKWSSVQVFFAITIILSFMSWTGLARVVRSKFLSLREEDFILAARSYNTSSGTIIFRHMIPNFVSYLIVNLTLAIPGMILGETALSFLGIGLRPPVVSLGVLLSNAQNFQTVSIYPWLLVPGIFVVIAILAFNFVGDGLRDAADPYQ